MMRDLGCALLTPAVLDRIVGVGAPRHLRWEHEQVMEAAQKRLDENPQAMRQRRETVERPFETLKKMRMGATHFLMKRLPKVTTEIARTCSPTISRA